MLHFARNQIRLSSVGLLRMTSKDVRTSSMFHHDDTADQNFHEMDRQTNAAVRRGVVNVLRQERVQNDCDTPMPASLERLLDALRKQDNTRD